jgi:hypothetical protein
MGEFGDRFAFLLVVPGGKKVQHPVSLVLGVQVFEHLFGVERRAGNQKP